MKRILLVEDDYALALGIQFSLKAEGFKVFAADSLSTADEIIENEEVDLILLDVMLPDGNGYDYCKKLVDRGIENPIIFLTAVSDEVNIVQGLDTGADDYITKPFGVKELISRINAALRRCNKNKNTGTQDIIKINHIEIDKKKNKVMLNSNEVLLTPSEYRLLIELIDYKNTVLERGQLIQKLWDIDGDFVDDNTLSVYIKRLRDKIEKNPSQPEMIVTVRGVGYSFVDKG